MSTKYFGTDGLRAEANSPGLTPDLVMKVAQAAAQVMSKNIPHNRPTVVIGKDTRLSGYMIEAALQAGFTSMGFYCLLVGPLPTPAVSMLARSLRADLGVMITASHNPYQDNGIKIFTPSGVKICQEKVLEIEALVDTPEKFQLAPADKIGKAVRIEDAVGRYIEFCKTTLPKDFNLQGLRVVVDCAHGASYKIAPKMFWELGAQVIRIGTDPDGFNINRGCGATDVDSLRLEVAQHGADMGIALDGDGDRLILVDEKGEEIDGDHILASMATYLHEQGQLAGSGVVSTVMANMGLEKYLETLGLHLVRTPVGDHHVEATMRTEGYNLGGESSGHLIFRDYATTGDGILAALQILALLRQEGRKASSLRKLFTPYPMTLENVRLSDEYDAGEIVASKAVQKSVQQAEKSLGKQGRVLVRKSGTEPLIRVMVEAETEEMVAAQVTAITEAINGVL